MAGKFITSVANIETLPILSGPEVALAGRSNAGKSSLLNAWAGRSIAYTSQSPGKTTLLNFYRVDLERMQDFTLVDMPGYGYAKRAKTERTAWAPLVEGYLQSRADLKGVILVMDAQRPWTDDETHLLEWLEQYRQPAILVANKIDKMNQSERAAMRKEIRSHLVGPVVDFVEISARTKVGIEQLKRSVFENFLKV